MPRATSRLLIRVRSIAVMAAGLMLVSAAGCASLRDGLGFYWQSANGQIDLLRRSEPIEHILANPATDPRLRARLEFVQRVRRFAVDRLGLPDNGSYRRYAALDRPYVLWNVVAAPALSLRLQQWCFPVAGCVTYRGYFELRAGERFREDLMAQGMDVQFAGVPAFSTLGWFDDPVLSTFVFQSDVDVARLLFHELTHQLTYIQGDSTFNESYATAFEQVGLEAWLRENGSPQERRAVEDARRRRGQWLELLERCRARLETVYASDRSNAEKLGSKAEAIANLRREYEVLRETEWGGYRGYDRWFQGPIGNAHFGAVATYEKWVPSFKALWNSAGRDAPRFHRLVADLAKRPLEQRNAELERLRSEPPVSELRGAPPDAAQFGGPASFDAVDFQSRSTFR